MDEALRKHWLMPTLFGWRLVSYWQAMGILVLSKILFGGFRGRPGPPWYWRRRMMERWEKMTPEEREKFRKPLQSQRSDAQERSILTHEQGFVPTKAAAPISAGLWVCSLPQLVENLQ